MMSLSDDKQAILLTLLTLHPDIWIVFGLAFVHF